MIRELICPGQPSPRGRRRSASQRGGGHADPIRLLTRLAGPAVLHRFGQCREMKRRDRWRREWTGWLVEVAGPLARGTPRGVDRSDGAPGRSQSRNALSLRPAPGKSPDPRSLRSLKLPVFLSTTFGTRRADEPQHGVRSRRRACNASDAGKSAQYGQRTSVELDYAPPCGGGSRLG